MRLLKKGDELRPSLILLDVSTPATLAPFTRSWLAWQHRQGAACRRLIANFEEHVQNLSALKILHSRFYRWKCPSTSLLKDITASRWWTPVARCNWRLVAARKYRHPPRGRKECTKASFRDFSGFGETTCSVGYYPIPMSLLGSRRAVPKY
jgi:hypothetical protein